VDRGLRNALRAMVASCRQVLEEDVRRQLEGTYGLTPEGEFLAREDIEPYAIDPGEWRRERDEIFAAIGHIESYGIGRVRASEQFVRESASTILNRLAAVKLMEHPSRALILESVGQGAASKGFLLLQKVSPEVCRAARNGPVLDAGYRVFLELLFDDFAEELGVLFDRRLPQSIIFPSEGCLKRVLALINDAEIATTWGEDETIGWIYQYFTPNELRDKVRKESQTPRNSYELAFRNQFYTPQYVVRFLVDNTLGRMWFNQRRGRTTLVDFCSYLIADSSAGPTLAEKDPREFRILDPACGSGHFLLYAFQLLEQIYLEAWDSCAPAEFSESNQTIRGDYPDRADFLAAIPALILRHNLFGVDIDLRATQIAGLALWLRAQRSYQSLNLRVASRPTITRTNVVCAEPMPGERELLDEFLTNLRPRVLAQFVRVVFDKMSLAGEAGSLLRIEEDLRDAIAEARAQWLAGPKPEQQLLFGVPERISPQQLQMFDVREITDESFWQQAEGRVVEALRQFASRAANGRAYARRLFADDTARGFAFVDICRRRFSVVLMNPPFGLASKQSRAYIGASYRHTKHDLYAAFIERGLELLIDGGALGAITNRTGFFLSDFQYFREHLLLSSASLACVADLGDGVLDGATVSTAAYCLWQTPMASTTESRWFRMTDADVETKGEDLRACISACDEAARHPLYFRCINASFGVIRTSPLAYWVHEALRRRIGQSAEFEPNWGIARTGLQSLGADDTFIRAYWEVAARELQEGGRWVPFAKGGSSRKWYFSPYLVTDWEGDGGRQKAFATEKYGTVTRKITGMSLFFRPGITYTTYTNMGFKPRVLPEGAIFSLAGSGVFSDRVPLPRVLGYLGSTLVDFFLRMTADGRKWDPGYLKRIPVPPGDLSLIDAAASRAVAAAQIKCTFEETTREFISPAGTTSLGKGTLEALASARHAGGEELAAQISTAEKEIDQGVFGAFGFSPSDIVMARAEVERFAREVAESLDAEPDGDAAEDSGENDVDVDLAGVAAELMSFAIGCVLGRWDVRVARSPELVPQLQEPFGKLPAYAPGTLISPTGLPACSGGIVSEDFLRARREKGRLPEEAELSRATISDSEYPLRIGWDGILVDDAGHEDDIVRRVQEVLRMIFDTRADGVETEVCMALGVRDLREYFRNPKCFFEKHVRRYSKGRRKAPIYWLLQSPRRSYGLWLYYARLDRDTVFKALRNYVEPKIKGDATRHRELKDRLDEGRETLARRDRTKLEKEIERQDALLGELGTFKESLERVAALGYEPDHSDGVMLNIAPFHELTPWKEALTYWKELLDGRYAWSTIASRLRAREAAAIPPVGSARFG
jgi:hypothetical protein